MNRLGLLLLLFGCTPEPLNARAEEASVVLLKTEINEELDGFNQWVSCGGVAIDSNTIVTAAHCVTEGSEKVDFVTREQWYKTSDDYNIATVIRRSPARDLLWLKTEEVLDYTGLSLDRPSEGILVKSFDVVSVSIGDGTIHGARLFESDSGSGVFDNAGNLVAILTQCFIDASNKCVGDRGVISFIRE